MGIEGLTVNIGLADWAKIYINKQGDILTELLLDGKISFKMADALINESCRTAVKHGVIVTRS